MIRPEPIQIFSLNDSGQIRFNRLASGAFELRHYDLIGPGHTPCCTRRGVELPGELLADLARAMLAEAMGGAG